MTRGGAGEINDPSIDERTSVVNANVNVFLSLVVFNTSTQVPNGSVRCAAVIFSMSYTSPFAVLRP